MLCLISAIQNSDSVVYIYMYTHALFHVLFHDGLSQDIDYSSLPSTVVLVVHNVCFFLGMLFPYLRGWVPISFVSLLKCHLPNQSFLEDPI